MSNQNSALLNLQEIMKIGEQRLEDERRAKVAADAESKRRIAEERALAQAEAQRRTREAEEAREAVERGAREMAARDEAERLERELRVRLEVETEKRTAALTMRLAHEERMAQIALATKKRGRSMGILAALAALGFSAVLVGGYVVRSQMDTQNSALQASNARLHDLQIQQLADQTARDQRLASDIARGLNQPVPMSVVQPAVVAQIPVPRGPRGNGGTATHPTRESSSAHTDTDMSGLDGDAIEGLGAEGPRSHPRR